MSESSFIKKSIVASGNDAAARRLRVKLQRRDRYGRWVEMGGALSFLIKDASGAFRHIIGHAIGGDPQNDNNILVLVKGDAHLGDGVYSVPSHVAENIEAELSSADLDAAGIRKDVNGVTLGNVPASQVPAIADLVRRDATPADLEAATGKLSPEETRVVDEARAAAPAHVSASSVPSDGTSPVSSEVATPSPHVTRIPTEHVVHNSDTNTSLPSHIHPALLSYHLVTAPNGNVVNTARLNADGTPVYTPQGNLIRDVAAHNRAKSWQTAERGARADSSTLVTPTNPGSTDNPNFSEPTPAVPDASNAPLTTPADASATVAPSHTDRLKLHPEFDRVRPSHMSAGQKRIFNSLVGHRNQAIEKMKALASSDRAVSHANQKDYYTNYQKAAALTTVLNSFVADVRSGRAAEPTYAFGRGIIARRKNHYITNIDKNADGTINSIKSLFIGKNGKVYQVTSRWNPTYVSSAEVNLDGSLGGTIGSIRFDHEGGDVYHPGWSDVSASAKNAGLSSAHLDSIRLIAKSRGASIRHSQALSIYSEPASMLQDSDDPLHHHVSRRERSLFQRGHVLGLIGRDEGIYQGDFLNPAVMPTRRLSGYNAQNWYSGVIYRQDSQEYMRNIARYKANYNPSQVAGQDYPELFAGHIEGRPGFENKNTMLEVLTDAGYQGAEDHKEVARKIRQFATMTNSSYADTLNKLADGFEKDDYFSGPNGGLISRPVPIDESLFGALPNNPIPDVAGSRPAYAFEGGSGITSVVDRARAFTPSRRTSNQQRSESWSDSPQVLAERFTTSQLSDAVRKQIIDDNGTGEVTNLDFAREGGTPNPEPVTTAAIYHALKHQGADADMIFAQIYDAKRGDTKNVDALNDARNPVTNNPHPFDDRADFLASVNTDPDTIARARAAYESSVGATTSMADGTTVVNQAGNFAPADRLEARSSVVGNPIEPNLGLTESNTPGASPLRQAGVAGLISNDPILEGGNISDATPFNGDFTPQMTTDDWLNSGVTDNPMFIARNFNRDALKNAYTGALANGQSTVKLKFASGEERDIDVRGIRDALQHQNVDTNELVRHGMPNQVGVAMQDADPSVTSPANVVANSVVHTHSSIPGDNFNGTLASRQQVNLGGVLHDIERYNDPNGNHVRTIIRDQDGKVQSVVQARRNGVQVWDNPTDLGTPRNGDASLSYHSGATMEQAEHALSLNKNWVDNLSAGTRSSSITGRLTDSPDMALSGTPSVIKHGYLNPMSDAQRDSIARNLAERDGISDALRERAEDILNDPTAVTAQAGPVVSALKSLDLNDVGRANEVARQAGTPTVAPAPAPASLTSVSTPSVAQRSASSITAGERLHTADGTFIGTVRSVATDGVGNTHITTESADGHLAVNTYAPNDSANVGPAVPLTPEEIARAGAVMARRRASGNGVIREVMAAYPDAQQIPGSDDLVIASKEHTDSAGRRYRYDAVVHRSPGERFFAYSRRVQLDASGNEIAGTHEASNVEGGTHSAQALIKHIESNLRGEGGNAQGVLAPRHPGSWFTQSGKADEIVHPATGLRIHPVLVSSNDRGAEFIGTTGIRKTGNGIKDSLVGYVASQIDRGVNTEDIINTLGRDANHILTHEQIRDLVERVNSAAETPGVSNIAHLDRNNHIVREGDIVIHYNQDRTTGVITEERNRVGHLIREMSYDKTSGVYSYTDVAQLRRVDENNRNIPGRAGKPRPITTANVRILTRKNGEAPQNIYQDTNGGGALPVSGNDNTPRAIVPSGRGRGRGGNVSAPATSAPTPAPTSGGSLRSDIEASPSVGTFVSDPNNSVTHFPGDKNVLFTSNSNGNSEKITQIEDLENGNFRVTNHQNGDVYGYGDRQQALGKVNEILNNFNRQNSNAPAPANNAPASGTHPLTEAINRVDTPLGFAFTRPDMDTYVLSGDSGNPATSRLSATVKYNPASDNFTVNVDKGSIFDVQFFNDGHAAVAYAQNELKDARDRNIARNSANGATSVSDALNAGSRVDNDSHANAIKRLVGSDGATRNVVRNASSTELVSPDTNSSVGSGSVHLSSTGEWNVLNNSGDVVHSANNRASAETYLFNSEHNLAHPALNNDDISRGSRFGDTHTDVMNDPNNGVYGLPDTHVAGSTADGTLYVKNASNDNVAGAIYPRPDGKFDTVTRRGTDTSSDMHTEVHDTKLDAMKALSKSVRENNAPASATPAPATAPTPVTTSPVPEAPSAGWRSQEGVDALNNGVLHPDLIASTEFGYPGQGYNIVIGSKNGVNSQISATAYRMSDGRIHTIFRDENGRSSVGEFDTESEAVKNLVKKVNDARASEEASSAPATPATPAAPATSTPQPSANRLFTQAHADALNNATSPELKMPDGYKAAVSNGGHEFMAFRADGTTAAHMHHNANGTVTLTHYKRGGSSVKLGRSANEEEGIKHLARVMRDDANPMSYGVTAFTVPGDNKVFAPRLNGDTSTFYTPDGNEAVSIQAKPDGTYDVIDPFSGDRTNYGTVDAANSAAHTMINVHNFAGLYDSQPADNVPDANSPATPSSSPTIPSANVNRRSDTPIDGLDETVKHFSDDDVDAINRNVNFPLDAMAKRRTNDITIASHNGSGSTLARINEDIGLGSGYNAITFMNGDAVSTNHTTKAEAIRAVAARLGGQVRNDVGASNAVPDSAPATPATPIGSNMPINPNVIPDSGRSGMLPSVPATHTPIGDVAQGNYGEVPTLGSTNNAAGRVTPVAHGNHRVELFKNHADMMLGKNADEDKVFASRADAIEHLRNKISDPESIGVEPTPASSDTTPTYELPDTHSTIARGDSSVTAPTNGDLSLPAGRVTFDPASGSYTADTYKTGSGMMFGDQPISSKTFPTREEAQNHINGHVSGADTPKVSASQEAQSGSDASSAETQRLASDILDIRDLTGFTKIADATGSNPGGTYQDANGKKYYVKIQQSQEHADNEVLASALYQRLGLSTVTVRKGHFADGRLVTFSPILEGSQPDGNTRITDPDYLRKVQSGFAADAWLANWDVIGSNSVQNIISDADGNPVRVDNGGAILFRAKGTAKANSFGNNVPELQSLVNASTNRQGARVFGSMTDADKKESAERLLNISDKDIDDLTHAAFGSTDQANQLADKLKARRKFILDNFGIQDTNANQVSAVDNATSSADNTVPTDSAPAPLRIDPAVSRTHRQAYDTLMADSNFVATDANGIHRIINSSGLKARIGQIVNDMGVPRTGTMQFVTPRYGGPSRSRLTMRNSAIEALTAGFSSHVQRLNEQTAAENATTPAHAKAISDVVDHIQHGLLARATRLDLLRTIISSGEVKTLFETGSSDGNSDQNARYLSEIAHFNLNPAADRNQHPVYGFMVDERSINDRDNYGVGASSDIEKQTNRGFALNGSASVGTYGSSGSVIVFKKQLRERATMTFGNSLNKGRFGMPVNGEWDMHSLAMAGAFGRGRDYGSNLLGTDHTDVGAPKMWTYPEIQIHGANPTLDDIDTIFVHTDRDRESILEHLASNGRTDVKVAIMPPSYGTV